MNPGGAQGADHIRDRRAAEGTLGKPQPDEQADPTDSLAAGFRDVTGVTA
jgi:hypothetical protein